MAADSIPFTVRTTVHNGLVEVAVIGELDLASAAKLGDALGDVATPGRVIVVDLSETEFLDCAGLRALTSSSDRQRQLGGEVILDSPTPAVARVLQLTQVDQQVTVLGRPDDSSPAQEVLG